MLLEQHQFINIFRNKPANMAAAHGLAANMAAFDKVVHTGLLRFKNA